MNVWTVRHPPTHTEGICVGQHQVPLKVSLDHAVETVLNHAPFRPTVLFSSDLPRCERLATQLALYWGIPHHTDERLREISMGEWEGQRYDDLQGDPYWEEWCKNWLKGRPPNGESLADLENRVQEWLDLGLLSKTSLLISHAGVVRTLYRLKGISWMDAMKKDVPHLIWIQIKS